MTARGTMAEQHRTWVVALDGARARVFAFTDRDAALAPVTEWLSPDAHRLAGDGDAHRLGHAEEHAGHARHAKDPKADPYFRRKQEFIGAVARNINQACADRTFDSLVVVAPAQALGALRSELSPAAQERIKTELVQDLTKVPDHEIAEHLARDLPVHTHAPRLQRGG
jgi:protein required for attachment to host cells